jgi:hypothetical protein
MDALKYACIERVNTGNLCNIIIMYINTPSQEEFEDSRDEKCCWLYF